MTTGIYGAHMSLHPCTHCKNVYTLLYLFRHTRLGNCCDSGGPRVDLHCNGGVHIMSHACAMIKLSIIRYVHVKQTGNLYIVWNPLSFLPS